MADDQKLALDKAGLGDFIDHQIVPFRDSLQKIANVDNEEGPTMSSLLGNAVITQTENNLYGLQKPLAIGQMLKDDSAHGASLVKAITQVAGSINQVYQQQTKLFNDLHDNLQHTIDKLMDAQNNSLTQIDGKTFLDSLGTASSDFQNTGTGNSNGNNTP